MLEHNYMYIKKKLNMTRIYFRKDRFVIIFTTFHNCEMLVVQCNFLSRVYILVRPPFGVPSEFFEFWKIST